VLKAAQIDNPNVSPWRSQLAFALMPDDPQEARRLVNEELEAARRVGTDRGVGVALRAAALVGTGEAIHLLIESREVLAGSPATLERARSEIELGSALRRHNQRLAGREHLRVGLDLADRCGAIRLTTRAEEELRASGARPRRRRVSGVDALTPSEARVARMAAAPEQPRDRPSAVRDAQDR
jgi:hypothetical protein